MNQAGSRCDNLVRTVKPMTKHMPTYNSWKSLRSRCTNPNINRDTYLKISYDPSWDSYTQFLADMGERPAGTSIERKNNSQGYNKENCYWATPQQQCNNRSSNTVIEYKGKKQTISEWCRELGLNRGTVSGRVARYGYNPELLFAPADTRRDGGNPLTQIRRQMRTSAKDAKADD